MLFKIQRKEQEALGRRNDQLWGCHRSEAGREAGCGGTEERETGRQTFTKATPQEIIPGPFISVSKQKSQVLMLALWWFFSNHPSRQGYLARSPVLAMHK